MNQPNKVKTRVMFTAWLEDQKITRKIYDHEVDSLREGWNAALDSVILPEGKRFEVGEKVEVFDHSKDKWITATVGAIEDTLEAWTEPQMVRPLPQTRELTAEEKIDALGIAHVAWRDIAINLANGKTLDQLCAEYGIATMVEV